MKIKNFMTKEPKVISPDASIIDAVEMMQKFSIRHIPVVENDELVGFVTESTLRNSILLKDKKATKIRDIMIKNPITIDQSSSIDHAARLIYEYRVGGLPVLDKRKLVGIFTTTDLVNALISLLGIQSKSIRLDITILDKNTHLDHLISFFISKDVEVISIILDPNPAKKRTYVIRVLKCNIQEIISELEESKKFKVLSYVTVD